MSTQDSLKKVYETLELQKKYAHAAGLISFDRSTVCPPKGMGEQGEVMAFLANEAFKLSKDEEFIRACEDIYAHRDELDEFDKTLAKIEHRAYLASKNITPEKEFEFTMVFNNAYDVWLQAREKSDYSMFEESLSKVIDVIKEQVKLREPDPDNTTDYQCDYDYMLDDYEDGMTSAILDETFAKCRDRIVPLLKKVQASKKVIRTDFMKKVVADHQQEELGQYILDVIGFDKTRGAMALSEHPFTQGIAVDDTRVTTHYYSDAFASSMYSVIHEGGHALFEQNQPAENHSHFITSGKTLGQHESVSRFYENRIGRSRSFISLVYPKICEIFPEVMDGVSENELYEGVNVVTADFIRTEADELTYTLHIIIRYEIERLLVSGEASVADVPRLWKEKYEEYLGITPPSDRLGVLQDMHWTSGMGYFPTYALGNMYNAMYYNKMREEFDIEKTVAAGDMTRIRDWMTDRVFKKADRLAPREWIRDITGREFTPDDFLDYLEEKFGELYEL